MKPLTLLIKPVAGLCNMNCKYCFYKKASENRENSVMTRETADLLVHRIKEYQPSYLNLIFQGGEPTLAGLAFYEYFTAKIKKNIKTNVYYSIQTNGLLVDSGFADFFHKNGFLVGVSLDGGRKTNDRYRLDKNGNSVLPQVLTAINTLKKYNVPFNILSVVDDENASDVDSTYAYFKKHGFYDLQFIPFVDECEGVSLSSGAYEEFLKRLFDLWYDDFTPDDFIRIRHLNNYLDIIAGFPPENCAMCGFCGSYYVVEANGDIYPCDFYCKEEYKLGNLSDGNPFELTEKQRKFVKESFIIQQTCKECKYYRLCRGGCKRDRTDGFTKNKYCRAYYNFFEYSLDRMDEAVKRLKEYSV